MRDVLSRQIEELYQQCLNWLAVLLLLVWLYPSEQAVVAFVVPLVAGMALVWWLFGVLLEDEYV